MPHLPAARHARKLQGSVSAEMSGAVGKDVSKAVWGAGGAAGGAADSATVRGSVVQVPFIWLYVCSSAWLLGE